MSHVVPSRQEPDSRMLWIQLLAGPVLWSVHFLIKLSSCGSGMPGGVEV